MNPYPLPATFYPKKTKRVRLLLIAISFTVGGIFLIKKGENIGWFATGFFGLGIPVFALQLHPRAAYLTLTDDGLEFSSLFRRSTIPWSAISDFGTYNLKSHGISVSSMVGINFVPTYPQSTKARAIAKALTGFEGGLPDT